MLSKEKAKLIRSLKNKKYREESGLFVVEGQRSVEELLKSSFAIQDIFAVEDFVRTHRADLRSFDEKDIITTEKVLETATLLKTANDVIAVARIPEQSELVLKEKQFYLVLDNLRDPGNLGTIIRIADWYGIEHIICSNESADLYNPKVIQSTMGSFLRVKVHYVELESFLKNRTLKTYAASTRGTSIKTLEPPSGGLILIGNEAHGIRSSLGDHIDEWISIPGKGKAESLNASVATGIICSHWVI